MLSAGVPSASKLPKSAARTLRTVRTQTSDRLPIDQSNRSTTVKDASRWWLQRAFLCELMILTRRVSIFSHPQKTTAFRLRTVVKVADGSSEGSVPPVRANPPRVWAPERLSAGRERESGTLPSAVFLYGAAETRNNRYRAAAGSFSV